jgi:hypothetical protein
MVLFGRAAVRNQGVEVVVQLRKFLLRVMIWSLAVAAVLGAIAILTNGSDIVWRIAGTTGLTAACAAAMMATSLLLDKENGRTSGLVGMAAILVVAMFSLLLIWDLEMLIPTRRPAETIGLTIVFIIICALPAMAFLRGRNTPATRLASNAGGALSAITFGLLMIPSWFIHERVRLGSDGDWFATGTATGLLGLLAIACLVSIDTEWRAGIPTLMTAVRFAGLAAAVLAWGIALYGIWAHIHEASGVLTSVISIGCVSRRLPGPCAARRDSAGSVSERLPPRR